MTVLTLTAKLIQIL